jgi:phage nucleotide-binding protein
MATPQPVLQPKQSNLKFLKASEVKDAWGINLLVYGPPGVGKTTLAASAQDSPHGADVLFIDVEGGVRSIADRDDITIFRPATFNEVREVFHELQAGNLPQFKTVVVDSIGETQALGLRPIMSTAKNPDLPGLQDYGKSNEQISGFIRGLRGLAQTRGVNVIITALAVETKDETTGAVLTRPALTPKALELIAGAVDMMGYLTQTSDGTRVLKFTPSTRYMAKLRQPQSQKQIPLEVANPSLVGILEYTRTQGPRKGEPM